MRRCLAKWLLFLVLYLTVIDGFWLNRQLFDVSPRRLTFGGTNSAPVLSEDGQYVIFEGSGSTYGTSCQQIYRVDVERASRPPQRLSTGFGDTNAPSLIAGGQSGPAGDFLYAATFHRESLNMSIGTGWRPPTCPDVCTSDRAKIDTVLKELCANSTALWELKPAMDVFRANAWGNFRAQLTNETGYDGEPVASPDGRWVVYTSTSGGGDPDLWLMRATTGAEKRRLTTWPGYEGGAQFSPDGRKIIFHATRPLPGSELTRYRTLLAYNLVELKNLRVYVLDLAKAMAADGADAGGTVIPLLSVVNGQRSHSDKNLNAWTPTFWPNSNGRRVVYSSNAGGRHSDHYRLFAVDLDRPEKIEQLTFHSDAFDAFPTFDARGRRLVWASTAAARSRNEIDLFIADLRYESSSTDDEVEDDHDLRPLTEDPLHFHGEDHLANIRQLTFGGQNAEGYFSFGSESIILQAAGRERYGTDCDQIYRADFQPDWPAAGRPLPRLSTGLGTCTCSYFFPDDQTSIHAATFGALSGRLDGSDVSRTCPPKRCSTPAAHTDPVLRRLCNTSYTWDIFPDYDIYKVNQYGNIIQRLTDTSGYDAEGAVSPDGRRIVFTSMRTGDPELWLMDADGGNLRQLTDAVGYDGGPFFSPDGSKVGYRASRPQDDAELKKYRLLLSYDLVEPLAMELYTINVDGEPQPRRITALGGSNWAPFYLNDNFHVVFSSNFNATGGNFGAFDLYVIGEDGSGLQRVTYNRYGFDAFPMQSRDSRRLVWGSSRGGQSPMDLNLFLADWINGTVHRRSRDD